MLDKKMELLGSLHTKRLMVTFDDSSEAAQERSIEAASGAITQCLRQAERDLKQVVAGGGDASDEKVRRNIQMSLAKKLQERSSRFRGLQKEYMVKLQGQRLGAAGASELEFLNAEGKKKKGQSTSQIQIGFTQQQLQVRSGLLSLQFFRFFGQQDLRRGWSNLGCGSSFEFSGVATFVTLPVVVPPWPLVLLRSWTTSRPWRRSATRRSRASRSPSRSFPRSSRSWRCSSSTRAPSSTASTSTWSRWALALEARVARLWPHSVPVRAPLRLLTAATRPRARMP